MGNCCHDEGAFNPCSARQRRTLWLTLGINALMFGVIVGAAWYGRSTALLADSLDNLGDALTYGLSLYVVSRNRMAKARRHVVLVNNFPSIGSAEATSV